MKRKKYVSPEFEWLEIFFEDTLTASMPEPGKDTQPVTEEDFFGDDNDDNNLGNDDVTGDDTLFD